MKKLVFVLAFFTAATIFQQANAQLSININIGKQPVWGPTGYDHVDYYYLPDIDCYYDVNKSQFIYYNNNRWAFASKLPARYGNYNLYNGYKVVVNEPQPYLHADVYRNKYRNNKGPREKQVIIRDSHEEKYYEVKGHPKHNEWVRNHRNDGHGRH